MSVVDDSFGHPLKREEHASAPLAGGIMTQGYQCGMLWGAALAAGAQAYRLYGTGPQAETAAIIAAQRLVESFRAQANGEINCLEITDMNFESANQVMPILKFFVKGGKIGPGACFRLAAGYAQDAFNVIDSALPEEPVETLSQPVSCAAVLARKMGASEMHVVMASGFAGGIGLSGGACGALGTAIWLTAMDNPEEGANKLG